MYTYTHLKYLLGYLPLAFLMIVCVMLLYIVYDGIFFFYMYSKKRCNVLSQDQQFVEKKNKTKLYFLNFCTYLIEKC